MHDFIPFMLGTPVSHTWTHLASTAFAGSKVITLDEKVDWKAGDEIVIATTGDFRSQAESEVISFSSILNHISTI